MSFTDSIRRYFKKKKLIKLYGKEPILRIEIADDRYEHRYMFDILKYKQELETISHCYRIPYYIVKEVSKYAN